jgi:hypothetical protein
MTGAFAHGVTGQTFWQMASFLANEGGAEGGVDCFSRASGQSFTDFRIALIIPIKTGIWARFRGASFHCLSYQVWSRLIFSGSTFRLFFDPMKPGLMALAPGGPGV